MRTVLERSRYLMYVAVVALALTSVVTTLWGAAKAVEFVRVLLEDDGWRGSTALVELLEVIDTFLLATVVLIFAIGLYELFIGELSTPDWLVIDSLTRLKGKLSDVIILVLAIKFLEYFAGGRPALDVLYYGASTSLVAAVLIAFNAIRQRSDAGH